MIVIVVNRVTPALRGTLSRWLLEVHAGVFVGHVSTPVRDRLWAMVQERRRLGACTLISRAPNEHGFTITSSGDNRRAAVDYDGLTLIRVANKISGSTRAGSKAAVNPTEEVCGGDPSARGPVEAEKLGREAGHPERTVLPK